MEKFTHQDLRRSPTVYEHELWQHLRARKMVGLKFRRQHPLGPYIVDFVCLSRKIVVEIDGPVHRFRKAHDQRRDTWLKSQGFVVIRIENDELEFEKTNGLMRLRKRLLGLLSPPLPPPRWGGEQ